MRRIVRTVVMLAASLLVGWIAGSWRVSGETIPAPTTATVTSVHTGPTIEQVQALATLITARVAVADVQETRLAGYTGAMRAVLVIKGDYLLGVDLSKAKFEKIDQSTCHAVLILPQPSATSPRLDHEHTRIFAIADTGLWQITPGDSMATPALVNAAYRDAERFVVEASQSGLPLEQSRRRAEQALGAFFESIGWNVEVRWN